MRRCPACQNTFDDSKRFCQIDGTLLVDEPQSGATSLPSDPLKTQFGGAGIGDGAPDVSPFGDDATKALNHETGQMPFDRSAGSPSASFGDSSPAFGSSPFSNEPASGTSTPFAEPPPQQPSFNSSPFDTAQNSYGQPLQQSAWTPPPAPDAGWQSQNIGANTPFQSPVAGVQGQNQTLPIVSLVCGVLGFVLVCCWGGIPFGLAALITGYIGKQNLKNNPMQYGGGGMATAGMILGGIAFALTILLAVLGIAGNILGSMAR